MSTTGVWTDDLNLGNSYSLTGNDAINGRDPWGLQKGPPSWEDLERETEKRRRQDEAERARQEAFEEWVRVKQRLMRLERLLEKRREESRRVIVLKNEDVVEKLENLRACIRLEDVIDQVWQEEWRKWKEYEEAIEDPQKWLEKKRREEEERRRREKEEEQRRREREEWERDLERREWERLLERGIPA